MKKFLLIIILFFTAQCSWADLDGSFDYMSIPTESLGNIQFGQTTFLEAKKLCPNFKNTKLDDGQTILVNKPKNSIYSEIRMGFNQDKVQWIDFILKEKEDLGKILSRYGYSDDINCTYSDIYDYYDYSSFNIAADKKGQYFYSISLFKNPELPQEFANFDKKLPSLETLKQIKVFTPGAYLEETFGDTYDNLYPKFNDDGTKTYTIKNNITSTYQKVELIFKHGILKSLILYPKNTSLVQIENLYGKPQNVKSTDDKIIYYYGNFSLTTDLKNQVLKITF